MPTSCQNVEAVFIPKAGKDHIILLKCLKRVESYICENALRSHLLNENLHAYQHEHFCEATLKGNCAMGVFANVDGVFHYASVQKFCNTARNHGVSTPTNLFLEK